MEAHPPSYETATRIDPWHIIARYIPSNDLCSAALVCSTWHSTFTPHLWGNPASHFGIENDHVYVALTKFKRTLQTARLLVRSQTHTLHLPPAHAELYNGPHATWLRDILDRLPSLQSLIVRGLPFFDYSALQALKYKRPSVNLEDGLPSGAIELLGSAGFAYQRPADFIPSFGLRLLDASRCSNVTASSLAQALGRFEGLLYLDLSFTYPARDPVVLKSLRRFQNLQVVKLRGISLNDEALEVLAMAIGCKVRSLDIRNNIITDKGARKLLDHCFVLDTQNTALGSHATRRRSQTLLPYLGHEMLEIYQGEDFESFIRNAFTGRFIDRLAIEDLPEGGITHLYVSGNPISIEGVSDLVRTGRLHVLDVQSTVSRVKAPQRTLSNGDQSPVSQVFGAEQLTPVMHEFACDSMMFLRIDHSLVTHDSPHQPVEEAVIPGRIELDDTALPILPDAVELSATAAHPDVFEMPAVETPKYELAGDPLHFYVSPAINDQQHETEEEKSPAVAGPRRGTRLTTHITHNDNLHPAMLPRLTTLVLTNIPTTTPSKATSTRLINFIRQCAQEAQVAKHQAQLDYSLPPGRRGHAAALKHAAQEVFALKRIVLELAPPQSASSAAEGRRASQWQHACTKSVTEDHDSESLWSAAETDFSFFGDEDADTFPSLVDSSAPLIRNSSSLPTFDTVALLSAFRRERAQAHARSLAAGALDPDTEGYWAGAIQIVRPEVEQTGLWERKDYYGNRFDGVR
ncbi:hypothetical protein BDY17DRAFT_254707 [Neohortaea acidophila]|uniref:F-box domain-containing protein n=1 Tax=Neohortaea acidophila TaxID=245834 RepID=A0A6A6PLE6_9PEZI|nr:uncharacterized protein BDY17DRAFT_254707 [Neohortaea acidophila]KAF2480812.1 hypothetical protein BDY17DRAFT_254707 [Neohortaea acidophila]